MLDQEFSTGFILYLNNQGCRYTMPLFKKSSIPGQVYTMNSRTSNTEFRCNIYDKVDF